VRYKSPRSCCEPTFVDRDPAGEESSGTFAGAANAIAKSCLVLISYGASIQDSDAQVEDRDGILESPCIDEDMPALKIFC
jgi:hypothetical protein